MNQFLKDKMEQMAAETTGLTRPAIPGHFNIHQIGDSARTGFTAAVDLLMPVIIQQREALEFYGDAGSYRRFEDLGHSPVYINEFLMSRWTRIVDDSGKIARKALEAGRKVGLE